MKNYQHYIAVDWSMASMAIARLTHNTEKLSEFEVPASVSELKVYLNSLSGSKVLMFEESNCAQWLYTELKSSVDRLVVCDPTRNRLLSEGPKSDKIDAKKLVYLLKSNLIKEVYHSGDQFIYTRKLVSYYQDLIDMGVKLKNQRSALFRSYGLNHKKDEFQGDSKIEDFVLEHLDAQIALYEAKKAEYEKKFKAVVKSSASAKLLKDIPGIGDIHAVEIVSAIVDIQRFPTAGHFLSYCGLIKHTKISGGRSYGKRSSLYNRDMKRIFKMAAFAALQKGANNPVRSLFEYLIKEKNYPEHQARNACSRKIATYVYGILRTKTKFKPRSFAKIKV